MCVRKVQCVIKVVYLINLLKYTSVNSWWLQNTVNPDTPACYDTVNGYKIFNVASIFSKEKANRKSDKITGWC